MQTREQRAEKTVMIATALGLFCRIIAIGALSLWAAVSVLGLNDDSTVSSLGLVIAAAAGVVLIVYLVRVRRRERAVTRGQLEPSRRSARARSGRCASDGPVSGLLVQSRKAHLWRVLDTIRRRRT